jgi:hypothetical protein
MRPAAHLVSPDHGACRHPTAKRRPTRYPAINFGAGARQRAGTGGAETARSRRRAVSYVKIGWG